mgnify:CR=1 FL=1
MTVTLTTRRAKITGNGSTTVFPFSFRVLADADIKVYLITIATGASVLVSSVAYTLAINSGGVGGSVTYPLTGLPISSATLLMIVRETALTQPISYVNQSKYYADTVMQSFDRLTLQVQELEDVALKVSEGADGIPQMASPARLIATKNGDFGYAPWENGKLYASGAAGEIVLTSYPTVLDETLYRDVAALQASVEAARGVGIDWRAGNFVYTEVASGETLTTAAGVKLLQVAPSSVQGAEAFGVSTANSAATNDAAFVKAFAWLNAGSRRKLTVGAGTFNISTAVPDITQNDVIFSCAGRESTVFVVDASYVSMKFLLVTGVRVRVEGFRVIFSNLDYTKNGYALQVDDNSDVIMDMIRVDSCAGLLRIGNTVKSSRLRFTNIRASWLDEYQHRIVDAPRFTGMVMSDVVAYGSGTEFRTVPIIDMSPIGLCDTLNWNKVTFWTRAGSKYGVYVNADSGAITNCWFTEVIMDKTGRTGAAYYLEMTAASTASALNKWKIQNFYLTNCRNDHGGPSGDDDPGSIDAQGGKTMHILQGASNGFSYIRGINMTNHISTIRDEPVIVTERSGTDTAEDFNMFGCSLRDATTVLDGVDYSIRMGLNKFTITNCLFSFAEVPPINLNIDYGIEITNADIENYIITDNRVYNADVAFIVHPTYTVQSTSRIIANNTPVNGDDTSFTTITGDVNFTGIVKADHTYVDTSALSGSKSRTFDTRGLAAGATFTYICKTTGGFAAVIRDYAAVSIANISAGRRVVFRWTGTTLELDGVSFLDQSGAREVLTYSTDAAVTVSVTTGSVYIISGAITADRNMNLSSTLAYQGARILFKRTATGAFNSVVRDADSATTLTNLAVSQWCEVQFVGAIWILLSKGSLL